MDLRLKPVAVGWECPRCSSVFAPDVPECRYCNGGGAPGAPPPPPSGYPFEEPMLPGFDPTKYLPGELAYGAAH